MKATPLSPAETFGNQIRYVVPLFQRPHVWNEEDQWAPLWEDVARVAETVLDTPPPAYGPRMVPPHFLGAVVVESQRRRELHQRAGRRGRPAAHDHPATAHGRHMAFQGIGNSGSNGKD